MMAGGRSTGGTDILVLTQYYAPEPNVITTALAEHLALGADVTVIASHPNFPTGRFFAGFKFWRPERRRENGVTVWRLPVFPDRSKSKTRRAISYLSFALGATIAAPFLARKARVVWVYQTPFTTGLAALYHKYVLRARVVFAAVDLWPETFASVGVSKAGPFIGMCYAYRRWINRRADLVVCSTQGTLRTYAADGVPARALTYLPIWVEGIPQVLPPVAIARVRRIVYAGNIGWAQALDTLIQAAAIISKYDPTLRFELYGVGSALERMSALAKSLGATNVSFHGWRPPSEVFSIVSNSLAQIVSLQPDPLLKMTLPSKLPFALACGTPILAGLEGEAADVADGSGGAVVYDAAIADSLVAAIQTVVNKTDAERAAMGERLQHTYNTAFLRENLLSTYAALLTSNSPVSAHVVAERLAGASR
jgi:glycosyltransferase involved in cell wall biosynthesis